MKTPTPTDHAMTSDRSVRLLREWWERQRGARESPCRSELDPAELVELLPDVLVVDVAPDDRGGHVFTYRLAGTRVDDRLGLYLKGKTVQEAHFGEATDRIQHEYEIAATERRPVHCAQHRMVVGETRYVEYERLVVPLADASGDRVVALVAAVNFTCAFDVGTGPSPTCGGPADCHRKYLCLPLPIGAGRL